jgi:hypothetical protein
VHTLVIDERPEKNAPFLQSFGLSECVLLKFKIILVNIDTQRNLSDAQNQLGQIKLIRFQATVSL